MSCSPAEIDRLIQEKVRCSSCEKLLRSRAKFVVVDAVVSLGKRVFFHTQCAPFVERGWTNSKPEKLKKALEEIIRCTGKYESSDDAYIRKLAEEALQ